MKLNTKMGIVFGLLVLISFLTPQGSYDDFDMYSYPTEWEFEVFRYTWELLSKAPPGTEVEEKVEQHVADKYTITTEYLDKILLKLEYYFVAQDHMPYKLPEDMSWSEFELFMRKIGPPWPEDRNKEK